MRKFFFLLVIVAALAVSAVGAAYLWLTVIYAQSGNGLKQEVEVMIPPGTGSYQIALELYEQKVIDNPEAFRLLAQLASNPTRFQAGEYAFAPGITPLGIMDMLSNGEVIGRKVTIPEGYTSAQIHAALMAQDALTGTPPMPKEGSLLPNTYQFTRGQSRQSVLQQMAEAQQAAIESLWPQRQQDLPFTTPQEAITLASIVEKETGIAAERKRIAAVYINRLRINMPLQADPTVAYGIYGGQFNDKPLTYADLKTDHPYNTYTRPGLPQGPICHPGKDAIEAVLNPLQTKELYFVATGDGGHAFAETHAQHLNNVASYRKWQRQQRTQE